MHQRDNDKLLKTLKHLRDLGNSLIVVEHDEDTMLEADYIVDIGPGAGEHGGEVVAAGTAKEIMRNKNSITGAYPVSYTHLWKKFLGKDIIPKNNSCALYFEEQNMEAFIEKLETLYPSIQYVNRLMVHSWGQKVIRFYDLDGNLIEVGTPMFKRSERR